MSFIKSSYHHFHEYKKLPDNQSHVFERVVFDLQPDLLDLVRLVQQHVANEQCAISGDQMILHVAAGLVYRFNTKLVQ